MPRPLKLIGMMAARNEAWIIGLSARVALMWCDELVALDHASTDDTPQILEDIARETGRLTMIQESDPTWAEMDHRQKLLDAARERGGTHLAIVDADEILTANMLGSIKGLIFLIAQPGRVLCLPMYCMWRSLEEYRTDGTTWAGRIISLAFPDHAGLCYQPKNGYHLHHREPHGAVALQVRKPPRGGVMHCQWANWRRLTAKHALYKMQEVIRWPGRQPIHRVDRMYSMALDERGLTTAKAPLEWWHPYRGLMKHYRPEETPWQETECKALWDEFGDREFRGLNLFGVVRQKEVACPAL